VHVTFDFSLDGGFDAVKCLEVILRSNHWSDSPLDLEDEMTMLLLKLIRFGDIEVYKRVYSPATETPELRRHAQEINFVIKKRHISRALLDIADIFSGYEFDRQKTEFNSLFFPELKAYVRHGGLPPDRLLELLERDGCEKVYLFPNTYADNENAYFVFILACSKKHFLKELEKTNERVWEKIHVAITEAMEKSGNIFPDV